MSASRGRLLFTIPSLRGGGSERVFALVAGGLSERGFDVHLALAQRQGPWLERLPRSVTVHDLRASKVRNAAWPLWRLVRRLQPSTVLSTMTHMNKLVGLMRTGFPHGTRVVLRESTFLHLEKSFTARRAGALHRAAYRAADAVICLTDTMREALHREFRIPLNRLERIYNPMEGTIGSDPPRASASATAPRLLSIGRMDESKGFDLLLAAFPACLKRFPGATLTLVGDGPDRKALIRQAQALGVADRVAMPGFDRDVARRLQDCDLFVLASRFEGLPNVLLEAIDADRPVVVREHPGGTGEILRLLGLSSRMTTQLAEWREEWFEAPAATVRETALRHFGISTIVDAYAALVEKVNASRRMAA